MDTNERKIKNPLLSTLIIAAIAYVVLMLLGTVTSAIHSGITSLIINHTSYNMSMISIVIIILNLFMFIPNAIVAVIAFLSGTFVVFRVIEKKNLNILGTAGVTLICYVVKYILDFIIGFLFSMIMNNMYSTGIDTVYRVLIFVLQVVYCVVAALFINKINSKQFGTVSGTTTNNQYMQDNY